MAIHDFVRRRRVVREGDRRWSVSPPTLETVILAIDEFGGMLQSLSAIDALDHLTIARAVARIDPKGARTVLETCVSGPEDGEWPVEKMLEAALSLCDLNRILKSFSEKKKEAKPEESKGITGLERFVIHVAERFSVTPMDVMSWPYEVLLTLGDELDASASPPAYEAFRQSTFNQTPFQPQKFVESPRVN